MNPVWKNDLRIRPDDMVNTAAIADNGLIVSATWYHNYSRSPGPDPIGTYAVYLAEANTSNGNLRVLEKIKDCFSGVYTVAIAPQGNVAAAGGWLANTAGPGGVGLLRAYDTAKGSSLFPNPPGILDRVNSVSLSGNGNVLAAAADRLYVYFRQSNGTYGPAAILDNPLVNPVNSVAVHPSGEWLVCSDRGHVCLVMLSGSGISKVVTFAAPNINFRSVAVAREALAFAAGGGQGRNGNERVYYFDNPSMSQSTPGPAAVSAVIGESVRWVAQSADGKSIVTVTNADKKGKLVRLSVSGSNLNQDWEKDLNFKPNGVSMDGGAKVIAAADGFDADQLGGNFYVFDGAGTLKFTSNTAEMNWPIAVSHDGKYVVAGSDDGNLYRLQ